MAFISLRQLLDHAAENGYGVPAFNVNNLEQIHAIMQAARGNRQPGDPAGLRRRAQIRRRTVPGHMVLAAVEAYPDIPLVLHQDHGASPAVCQQSMRSGFTSVMMDGSLLEDGKTPSSYEYNVDIPRFVTRMAHAIGVSVEGELGCLGSLETGMAGEEDGVGAEGKLDHSMLLTDPHQAARLRRQDRCRCAGDRDRHLARRLQVHPPADRRHPRDRSASGQSTRRSRTRIWSCTAPVSVPQEWLAIIREYGGDIKETYGVPVEEIQRGIKSRRAQGQHRHRHPPGHDRGDAQVVRREPQRVRPAQGAQGARPPPPGTSARRASSPSAAPARPRRSSPCR